MKKISQIYYLVFLITSIVVIGNIQVVQASDTCLTFNPDWYKNNPYTILNIGGVNINIPNNPNQVSILNQIPFKGGCENYDGFLHYYYPKYINTSKGDILITSGDMKYPRDSSIHGVVSPYLNSNPSLVRENENDIINSIAVNKKLSFISDPFYSTTRSYPRLVTDVPATNCVKLGGNGAKKIVFSRFGYNGKDGDILGYIKKVIDYKGVILSEQPYVMTPDNFSFYVDLRQWPLTIEQKELQLNSSCGSDAYEYRNVISTCDSKNLLYAHKLQKIYDKLPNTVNGEIPVPLYLSSIAATQADSINSAIVSYDLTDNPLASAFMVALDQISEISKKNKYLGQKLIKFTLETANLLGKKYSLDTTEISALFMAILSDDIPLIIKDVKFIPGSIFSAGLGSKVIYSATKHKELDISHCVQYVPGETIQGIIKRLTKIMLDQSVPSVSSIIDNGDNYTITGNNFGEKNIIKLTPVGGVTGINNSKFEARVNNVGNIIDYIIKFFFNKVGAQVISNTFYIIDNVAGNRTTINFIIPKNIPDGKYQVDISRFDSEWVNTNKTIIITGNGVGDPNSVYTEYPSITTVPTTKPKPEPKPGYNYNKLYLSNDDMKGYVSIKQISSYSDDTSCFKKICELKGTINTKVQLFAIAKDGNKFLNWSGDCLGTICEILFDNDKNVTANFIETADKQLTLFNKRQSGGHFTVNNNIKCESVCYVDSTYGSVVSIVAEPESGYQTVWPEGKCESIETNTCNLRIFRNERLEVDFKVLPVLTNDLDNNQDCSLDYFEPNKLLRNAGAGQKIDLVTSSIYGRTFRAIDGFQYPYSANQMYRLDYYNKIYVYLKSTSGKEYNIGLLPKIDSLSKGRNDPENHTNISVVSIPKSVINGEYDIYLKWVFPPKSKIPNKICKNKSSNLLSVVNPPKGFNVIVDKNLQAKLIWGSSTEFIGYRLYRNNQLLIELNDTNINSYIDNDARNGDKYKIEGVLKDNNMSGQSNEIEYKLKAVRSRSAI